MQTIYTCKCLISQSINSKISKSNSADIEVQCVEIKPQSVAIFANSSCTYVYVSACKQPFLISFLTLPKCKQCNPVIDRRVQIPRIPCKVMQTHSELMTACCPAATCWLQRKDGRKKEKKRNLWTRFIYSLTERETRCTVVQRDTWMFTTLLLVQHLSKCSWACKNFCALIELVKVWRILQIKRYSRLACMRVSLRGLFPSPGQYFILCDVIMVLLSRAVIVQEWFEIIPRALFSIL